MAGNTKNTPINITAGKTNSIPATASLLIDFFKVTSVLISVFLLIVSINTIPTFLREL